MKNIAQAIVHKAPWGVALLALSLLTGVTGVKAQGQVSPGQEVTIPSRGNTEAATPAPAQAAAHSATALSQQYQAAAIQSAAEPPGKVTIVPKPVGPTVLAPVPLSLGSPAPFAGVRVLRVPTACTPKTNSLDCVQDSSQAGKGASVEGRVRHGVIGEVGTARAATEGGGGAKREEACTPKAGELSCAPSGPASAPAKP